MDISKYIIPPALLWADTEVDPYWREWDHTRRLSLAVKKSIPCPPHPLPYCTWNKRWKKRKKERKKKEKRNKQWSTNQLTNQSLDSQPNDLTTQKNYMYLKSKIKGPSPFFVHWNFSRLKFQCTTAFGPWIIIVTCLTSLKSIITHSVLTMRNY